MSRSSFFGTAFLLLEIVVRNSVGASPEVTDEPFGATAAGSAVRIPLTAFAQATPVVKDTTKIF